MAINGEVVEKFFYKFTKLSYGKGEVVIRNQEPPTGVFYLSKGFVRQYAVSQSGEMLVLHVFKPGSFFPMWWAINDTTNRYTYDTVTPVEIYRAQKHEVLHFVLSQPDVLMDLTSRILSGLSGILLRMEQLVFESAYDKTVKFLLYYARDYGTETENGKGYEVDITQREIAAWIGTTRETASLQVEELKRKGLIDYRNRSITIQNIEKLEKESGRVGR